MNTIIFLVFHSYWNAGTCPLQTVLMFMLQAITQSGSIGLCLFVGRLTDLMCLIHEHKIDNPRLAVR